MSFSNILVTPHDYIVSVWFEFDCLKLFFQNYLEQAVSDFYWIATFTSFLPMDVKEFPLFLRNFCKNESSIPRF